MYERALRGYEEALEPNHTLTLQTVNNLGNLYADQGKLGEAEQMYARALRGYEAALGDQSVHRYLPALITMANMGILYAELGESAKAREMYSRALFGTESVYGQSSDRYKTLAADKDALSTPRSQSRREKLFNQSITHETLAESSGRRRKPLKFSLSRFVKKVF
jgi:tetratricopeptide (TPR) repeat protein